MKQMNWFNFFGMKWEREPKTLFYDWLYINAVEQNDILKKEILQYDGFTDIAFNPLKSFNCQAYSAALYVSLYKRDLLYQALSNIENYIQIITSNIKKNIDKEECLFK